MMEDAFASISSYNRWVVPYETEGIQQTLLLANFSQNSDLQAVNGKLKGSHADTSKNWLMLVRCKEGKKPKKIEKLKMEFEKLCEPKYLQINEDCNSAQP